MKILAILTTLLITGCASMTMTPNQFVTIKASDIPQDSSIECYLSNEEGRWLTYSNQAVKISRDGH